MRWSVYYDKGCAGVRRIGECGCYSITVTFHEVVRECSGL